MPYADLFTGPPKVQVMPTKVFHCTRNRECITLDKSLAFGRLIVDLDYGKNQGNVDKTHDFLTLAVRIMR